MKPALTRTSKAMCLMTDDDPLRKLYRETVGSEFDNMATLMAAEGLQTARVLVHTAVAILSTKGGYLVPKAMFVKASPKENWFTDIAIPGEREEEEEEEEWCAPREGFALSFLGQWRKENAAEIGYRVAEPASARFGGGAAGGAAQEGGSDVSEAAGVEIKELDAFAVVQVIGSKTGRSRIVAVKPIVQASPPFPPHPSPPRRPHPFPPLFPPSISPAALPPPPPLPFPHPPLFPLSPPSFPQPITAINHTAFIHRLALLHRLPPVSPPFPPFQLSPHLPRSPPPPPPRQPSCPLPIPFRHHRSETFFFFPDSVTVGSHQFKVTPGDAIYVEKLNFAHVNDVIHLEKVLLIGSPSESLIGRPTLPGAFVSALVEEHALDAKVIVFKKKRRKNYRRTNGHRQELTRLRILEIAGMDAAEERAIEAVA
ncbi:unnamed protein product [Closterium sp. Naga37s-1]|nr:unnamed protein product [Closterium sp. Naga37s-1]